MLYVLRPSKLLIIICAFLSFKNCFAQSPSIRSLELQLKNSQSDTSELRLLTQIGAAYTLINPIKKFEYSNRAKSLALKVGDNKAIADAYIGIGTSYSIRGLADSAIANYKKGYRVAKKVNYLEAMGRSLNNLGYTYDKMDDSRESIKCYFEALSIFKKLKLTKGINQCIINIGSIYYDLKQYKLAKSYFEQCYKSYKASSDSVGLGYSLMILANCYGQLKDYKKAEDYYSSSMVLKKLQADSNGVALIHKGLGTLYTYKKQYPQALANLTKAHSMVVAIQDKYEQAAVLLDLTDVYLETKDLKKAEQAALLVLANAKQVKADIGISESLEKLVSVYQGQKNIERAFYYQSAYIAARDSLISRKALKDITLVEYGRVRLENQSLTKNNEAQGILNSNNTTKIRHYSTLIMICLMVLIGAGLFLILQYKRNKEKQLANLKLQRQKDEIALINQELAQLNDIKTKFLAIISHDLRGPLGNLQMLFSMYREGILEEEELAMLMKGIEDNVIATSSFLDTLLEWAKSQLDGLVLNIVSFDVTSYLEKNIRLFDARIQHKKLKVNNIAECGIHIMADPNMIDMVIRNLLANSVKFCNPGDEIVLDAQIVGEKALISISDNGPGITIEQQSKLFSLEQSMSEGNQGEKGNHLGLILCRDTVLQNQGRLRFESNPGEKTTFWVELPAG